MDSYDGNKVVRWSECVWQPKPIRDRLTTIKIAALKALERELTEDVRQQLRDRGYSV